MRTKKERKKRGENKDNQEGDLILRFGVCVWVPACRLPLTPLGKIPWEETGAPLSPLRTDSQKV